MMFVCSVGNQGDHMALVADQRRARRPRAVRIIRDLLSENPIADFISY